MQPRKSCWPRTVALCTSAREPQKFSNQFLIRVFGTIREVQGRGPGRTWSVAQTPALHPASSASRAVSMGIRCEAGRAVGAGPVRASPPRLGEDSYGRGHRPELRRIPARRRRLQPPAGPGGSAGPARPPAGRGGGCPCLLPQRGLRGCAAASRNSWLPVLWPLNETRPTRPSKLSGGCSGYAGPGRASTPLPRGAAQGRVVYSRGAARAANGQRLPALWPARLRSAPGRSRSLPRSGTAAGGSANPARGSAAIFV